MTWERRVKREHTCNRPNAYQAERKRANVGDIWKCRKCSTRWALTYKGIPSVHRAKSIHENTWRRIVQPGTPRMLKPQPASPEPMIPAGRRTPPDTSWLRTETIHGSGRRTGPHPIGSADE